MTEQEVRDRVEAVRAAGVEGDDEYAHSLEDGLHQDVLLAIANGAPNAPEISRTALETLAIDFARWCA